MEGSIVVFYLITDIYLGRNSEPGGLMIQAASEEVQSFNFLPGNIFLSF